MAYAVKRFYQAQLGATLTTTLYTNPGSVTSVVTDIVVTNTDTSSRAVTIRMPGSSAGAEIFSAVTISPGETLHWEGHQVLLTTETITGGADVASKVTVHISGVEG